MSSLKQSDFIISHQAVPVVIIDRIHDHHFVVLQKVDDLAPFDVYPSLKSCYRPYVWEIARGRSGNSQHTFGERAINILDEKGACDITCENFERNKDALLDLLIRNTPYLRFAVYNSFIHADYKNTHNGKRLLFTSNSSSKWTFVKFV